MKSIDFSVACHGDDHHIAEVYHRLTERALKPRDVKLRIQEINWNKLWAFVQGTAMSPSSIDVSEVGTTWLKSLADTNALKRIPDDFIEHSEAKNYLSDAAWKSIHHISPSEVLFWPFMVDVRVIYYWRDDLEAVGISEADAFSSVSSIRETIEKLRAAGLPGWGASCCHGINTLYEVSSWVWATGKDYMSMDGTRTSICDEEVRDSISAYFGLAKFMDHPHESYDELAKAFRQKRVSVMMDGPWLWSDLLHHRSREVDLGSIGVAKPPGPPFLGGSTLVVWRHAKERILDDAFNLLTLLTSPNSQEILFEEKGLLPVNNALLNQAPFITDANLKIMIDAVSTGRYLPTWPIWGPLESSLVRIFGLVWQSLKVNGFDMKPELLSRHFEPLATRFDRMLDLF